MSTPRSESIARARQDDPFANDAVESSSDGRTELYAGLAKVMHETMHQFVTNTDHAALLNAAPSARQLRWSYTDALVTQAHAVLHSEPFTELHGRLQQKQNERSPMHWHLIEESMEAGVHTFVNTTESVFDAIASRASAEQAESRDSYVILDRLAKLGIDQFTSYRSVYLDTPANRGAFISQLQPYKTGLGFKPRYPLEAKVPSVLAVASGLRGPDDFLLDAAPLIKLNEFPESADAIGCPITFYSGQVKELWLLYADARRSLRRRSDFGGGILKQR